jgi:proton-translocating NADH-quinone oxidoreductase chain N
MNFPAFIWLILLPLLASPVIYLAGRLTRNLRRWWIPCLIAVLALALDWIFFILTAQQLTQSDVLSYTLGSVSLRMDGLSLLLAAVVLGLGVLVALFSGPYLSRETGQEKYYAMLVLMISMIIGLGCATDLFNLWIWFEAMAITSYLLVTFYREQPAALEAGIKYLVQSAAGSALILVGIALVFAATGTLGLAEIRSRVEPSALFIAAGALFVIGFGVKAALVPLHTWLPDAHSQAPSGISAMLSGIVIEAGLVALLRAISALFAATHSWPALLMGFGALNMLVGNLMALKQKQVKRLLAFSSVAQVGYILLGIGITFQTGTIGGAQGSFFHLFNHAVMKGLAFLSAGVLLYALHIAHGEHKPLTIADLAGASRRYPLAALTLSLAVLGLGGIPPLSGFMSKWQIFAAGFQSRDPWIVGLVIFAALNSVLSLAYYAPLINAMYRQKPSISVQNGIRMPVVMAIPLVILAGLLIIFGVWPGLANGLTVPASHALLASFGGG